MAITSYIHIESFHTVKTVSLYWFIPRSRETVKIRDIHWHWYHSDILQAVTFSIIICKKPTRIIWRRQCSQPSGGKGYSRRQERWKIDHIEITTLNTWRQIHIQGMDNRYTHMFIYVSKMQCPCVYSSFEAFKWPCVVWLLILLSFCWKEIKLLLLLLGWRLRLLYIVFSWRCSLCPGLRLTEYQVIKLWGNVWIRLSILWYLHH